MAESDKTCVNSDIGESEMRMLILTLASAFATGCAAPPRMDTEARVSYKYNQPSGEIVFRISR